MVIGPVAGDLAYARDKKGSSYHKAHHNGGSNSGSKRSMMKINTL